jgi:hypothetical protein
LLLAALIVRLNSGLSHDFLQAMKREKFRPGTGIVGGKSAQIADTLRPGASLEIASSNAEARLPKESTCLQRAESGYS